MVWYGNWKVFPLVSVAVFFLLKKLGIFASTFLLQKLNLYFCFFRELHVVTEKWTYVNSVCKSVNGKAASPVELLKSSIRRAWTINGLNIIFYSIYVIFIVLMSSSTFYYDVRIIIILLYKFIWIKYIQIWA